MNISTAIKKAMLAGKGITRENEAYQNVTIIPTNTDLCMVISNGKSSAVRWQPSAEDLVAEDWIVTK